MLNILDRKCVARRYRSDSFKSLVLHFRFKALCLLQYPYFPWSANTFFTTFVESCSGRQPLFIHLFYMFFILILFSFISFISVLIYLFLILPTFVPPFTLLRDVSFVFSAFFIFILVNSSV